jgi:Ca-activated chloride channel family protein
MPDLIDDNWIDEQLRSVPLPPELLARLGQVASLGDGELDHALCDVALPPALLDRLHAIGSLTDTDIDDDARHVALPAGVVPRLHRSVWRQAWQARLAHLAVAASLAFAIGGAGWLLTKEFRTGADLPPRRAVAPPIASSEGDRSKVRPSEDQPPVKPAPTPIENDPQWVQRPDLPQNWPTDGPTVFQAPQPLVAVAPSPRNIDDDPSPSGTADSDGALNPADVLGNSSLVTQPDLRVARGGARHGIAGPRVKGYDLLFEFRYGEHPVVHPGTTAALWESRVPIWTDTSSYELAQRAIATRQPLPPGLIRAEDFLAAMDYGFPAPSGSAVGIRTAAGPSPLGLPGTSLIQVGVQAGKFDRGRDFGTHLTLAVDISSSTAVAGRWEAMRRAMAGLVAQLSPRDRISIVLFSQRPVVLVREADGARLQSALKTLDAIEPRGLANLGAALETAAAIARGDAAPGSANGKQATPALAAEKLSSRLVLVTDGLGWIDPAAMPRLKGLLERTVASGVSWQVVDVRPDEVSDSRLEELAVVGHRKVRHAETGRAIARELHEALIGRRDVVAAGVSIKVTFNPDAIETYRLIGYDPTTAGGLISGPLEGDLQAGEATTSLYEVELKPDGAETVATVEVTWHDVGTEEIHHLKQPIGRLQFAPSWMESPLSLQLAVFAAETAEILRGSYFTPSGTRPLDQVAELADRANTALQGSESFKDLKALLNAARASRSAGR